MSITTLALTDNQNRMMRDIHLDRTVDGRSTKAQTVKALERKGLIIVHWNSVELTDLGREYCQQTFGGTA